MNQPDLKLKEATETQALSETQKCPVTESVPDYIEVEISEVDRQTAKGFMDIQNCLVCTALRNRGLNPIWNNPTHTKMEGNDAYFKHDDFYGTDELYWLPCRKVAPFYGPGVVGKVIKLRRVK